MIEHKGLPVAGYKPQSDEKVYVVNVMKQEEERVLRKLDDMKTNAGIDQRWLAIGRTQLEQAFMAINRAVFQPGRVELPGDTQQLDFASSRVEGMEPVNTVRKAYFDTDVSGWRWADTKELLNAEDMRDVFPAPR